MWLSFEERNDDEFEDGIVGMGFGLFFARHFCDMIETIFWIRDYQGIQKEILVLVTPPNCNGSTADCVQTCQGEKEGFYYY